MTARIAIVIPLLNEERRLYERMASLLKLNCTHDLIFVDGGSTDGTAELLRQHQFTRISVARGGRGAQIADGAHKAIHNCDVVLFLHIDTRLPENFAMEINEVLSTGEWGFFKARLDSEKFLYRVIQFMMNLRSSVTGIATGDQCIFVKASILQPLLGPLKDYPLMEDIYLSKSLKASCGRGRIIASHATTSVRYWQRKGIIRTILKMWLFRFLFYLGVSPKMLYSRYYS